MSVILPWLISFWIANIHITCWVHPSTLRRSNIYSYILSDCQSWFLSVVFFPQLLLSCIHCSGKTPQIIRAGDCKECWLHCSQQTTCALVPDCTPYTNEFTIQPFNNLLAWLAIQDLYIFRELWMTHAITHFSFFGYKPSGSNTDVRWIRIFTCKWSLWHLLPVTSYYWVMFSLF